MLVELIRRGIESSGIWTTHTREGLQLVYGPPTSRGRSLNVGLFASALSEFWKWVLPTTSYFASRFSGRFKVVQTAHYPSGLRAD